MDSSSQPISTPSSSSSHPSSPSTTTSSDSESHPSRSFSTSPSQQDLPASHPSSSSQTYPAVASSSSSSLPSLRFRNSTRHAVQPRLNYDPHLYLTDHYQQERQDRSSLSSSSPSSPGTATPSLSNNMFGNNRTDYLPLNATPSRSRRGPRSWAIKNWRYILLISLALIISVEVYFFGLFISDFESIKKFRETHLQWPPPPPPSPQASSSPLLPSQLSPPLPPGPLKYKLGPQSFPPEYSESSWYEHHTLQQLYPDVDPHRGELPAALKAILEKDPVRQPPPPPEKAPEITAEMWSLHTWNATSTTSPQDAIHAEKQPIESDWRQSPWSSWRPPLAQLAQSLSNSQPLPKVQFPFEDPTKHSGSKNDQPRDELIAYRQKLVRNAFLHAWEGYKKYAWGHDELKPVSHQANDNFNGWGATIVDALDTLLVMGLPEEYDFARQHVRNIDFRLVGGDRSAYGSADGRIPVFETAIRYLGGFLSAYDLSGDTLMRDRAEELAQLIMPAFETASGVPVGRVRMKEDRDHPFGSPQGSGSVVLAEAGSLLLEFTRLWQVTGNRTYFDRVQRTTDWLDYNMTSDARLGSLFPTTLYPERHMVYGAYSFGGMADSYYEYLIKEHQLLGGRLSQYSRMYSDSIDAARQYLIAPISTVPGTSLLTIGERSGSRFTAKLEHLTCFGGGMLGLGSRLLPQRKSDLELAESFTETCWWAYNATLTGIGPEALTFYTEDDHDRFETISEDDGTKRRGKPRGAPMIGVRSMHGSYLNRPETIESVMYMWRITGDRMWQERGWQMFTSWVTHCMTDYGFSAISEVNRVPVSWTDSMESFTFAETFKYYYLLFSPADLISLDEYVFTTEAHPLLLPQKESWWGNPGHGTKTFWNTTKSQHGSESYSGGEQGIVGGLTNHQKTIVYKQWQRTLQSTVKTTIGGVGGGGGLGGGGMVRSVLDGFSSNSDGIIKATLDGFVKRMDWAAVAGRSSSSNQEEEQTSSLPTTSQWLDSSSLFENDQQTDEKDPINLEERVLASARLRSKGLI